MNSAAKLMQMFKHIIIIAKNNGWIFVDPFANYKIRQEKVDRGYLLNEELEKIAALTDSLLAGHAQYDSTLLVFGNTNLKDSLTVLFCKNWYFS